MIERKITVYSGPSYPAVRSHIGNIVFSRNGTVSRGKAIFATQSIMNSPPPLDVSNLTAQKKADNNDLLVAVPRDLLPKLTMGWLNFAGIRGEFEQSCDFVVLCSHLEITGEFFSIPLEGFVIEEQTATQIDCPPYSFKQEEIKQLTAGFVPPQRTIFLNVSLGEEEEQTAIELFRPLTYFLGFLQARAKLLAQGINPDAVNFGVKGHFADKYELRAITNLIEQFRQFGNSKLYSMMETCWLPEILKSVNRSFTMLIPADQAMVKSAFLQDN